MNWRRRWGSGRRGEERKKGEGVGDEAEERQGGRGEKRKRWITTEERREGGGNRRQKEDKVDEEERGREGGEEEDGEMEGGEGESGGEELRMQLWVVTASRPVVGAQLQALASSPGEAAQTRQLQPQEKRCY